MERETGIEPATNSLEGFDATLKSIISQEGCTLLTPAKPYQWAVVEPLIEPPELDESIFGFR